MSDRMRDQRMEAASALVTIMEHGYHLQLRRASTTMYGLGLEEPSGDITWFDAGTPLDCLCSVDLDSLPYVHDDEVDTPKQEVARVARRRPEFDVQPSEHRAPQDQAG